jgi:hypothetical protein
LLCLPKVNDYILTHMTARKGSIRFCEAETKSSGKQKGRESVGKQRSIPEILEADADESVGASWPAARAKSDHQMDEKGTKIENTHLCV